MYFRSDKNKFLSDGNKCYSHEVDEDNRVYARAHITQHTMHDWSCYASCDGFLICAAEDTMIDDCAPGSTRRIRVATT